uniref:Golgi associated RAB2 interactor protein-like Rab2B-binding domain-containing protein n=1 Tax=Strix occidentalis caurina TaxID=311401 RepID=A0A8D0FNC2_STROC
MFTLREIQDNGTQEVSDHSNQIPYTLASDPSPPLSLFNFFPFFSFIHILVNRRRETISVHNRPSCVIIGISAVNPSSPIPDAMLVARVSKSTQQNLHLCLMMILPFFYRFFPLKFVELSVHSTEKHHLMLKLVNGRSYYLEICASPNQQQHLFHLWLQLISLLKPPEKNSNTEVNVKCNDFGTCCKKALSPDNPSKNANNHQSAENVGETVVSLLDKYITFPTDGLSDTTL